MSDLSQAIAFASRLYRQRAGTAYAGYIKRDPMARLELRPGRVNPYAIDLLGMPDADSAEFARYGAVIGGALDGIKSPRHAAQLQVSNAALDRLFGNLIPSCAGVSRRTTSSAAWSRPKAIRSRRARSCRCAHCCSSQGSRPRSRTGTVQRRNATIIRGPMRIPVTAGAARAPHVPVPAGG